ncbi:MAG TPA: ATP-dependent DNA ligase [Albitalea sp.]|nr:ATP-dependent DNA ligase [Albitalea sp.]
MKRFIQLFNDLDASTATSAKVEALKRYFAQADDADAAWAVYFLAGGKPRQVVPTAVLRGIACRLAGIPDWLFDECYQAVGDLAETIAHVLPPASAPSDAPLSVWVEERLLPLRALPPDTQAQRIAACWDELDASGRFLLTKLIGGGFRVGVSKLLMQRALAEHAGLDAKLIAQRMMGFTDKAARPDAAAYRRLLSRDAAPAASSGQPYPFFLAHAIDGAHGDFEQRIGPPAHWLVEWKYDGIRAQVVKRAGQVWIWSRGEELMTERFPEIVALAQPLPDGTVLDGEILVWKDGRPAPFALLQQRIGRKLLSKKVLAEAPVSFIAYDLLEWGGEDVRAQPQAERRQTLLRIGDRCGLAVSPLETRATWAELAALREQSRERGVEGFMLKHREARYGSGRTKAEGTWWKWKIEPLSVDAILVYAQAGHGRRASIYTDYTFAVWNRAPRDAGEVADAIEAVAARRPAEPDALQLVPFAKAYSGLSDEEFREVDRIVRQTTLEKFGPVRSVRPSLMFELGFEGINRSTRHKSGIAVRFPRMLRLRRDKPLHEADTLQTLEALLQER